MALPCPADKGCTRGTKVLETRGAYRQRLCMDCGHKFWTGEEIIRYKLVWHFHKRILTNYDTDEVLYNAR